MIIRPPCLFYNSPVFHSCNKQEQEEKNGMDHPYPAHTTFWVVFGSSVEIAWPAQSADPGQLGEERFGFDFPRWATRTAFQAHAQKVPVKTEVKDMTQLPSIVGREGGGGCGPILVARSS
jgi:hypothetical protein